MYANSSPMRNNGKFTKIRFKYEIDLNPLNNNNSTETCTPKN